MTQRSPESTGTHLPDITPAQAADVIDFYDRFENEEFFRNGWKRKVPLGRVAIHTAELASSIFPERQVQRPLLSYLEQAKGLAYLQQLRKRQEQDSWPVEPTDAQWEEIFAQAVTTTEQDKQIEKWVDTSGGSYDDAYYAVMGERRKNIS